MAGIDRDVEPVPPRAPLGSGVGSGVEWVTVLGVAAILVFATAFVAGAVLMSAQDAYGRWAFVDVGVGVMLGGAVLATAFVVLAHVLTRRELDRAGDEDGPFVSAGELDRPWST